MDKGQIIRFSKQELKLIKNTFAENDELITALYKHMLQFPTETTEQDALKALNKPDIMTILDKEFIPELTDDVPVEQKIDLWLTVRTEDVDPEEVYVAIKSRETVINYIKQQLSALTENVDQAIILKDLVNKGGDKHANLRARNTICNHVVQRVMELKTLAGKKEESEEEQAKRLTQNSNK